MCVALAALDATVEVEGQNGTREIAFGEFHRLPGDTPENDNTLGHDEIVTGIRLQPNHFADHYTYLKLRDRLSYAFALVSVAVAMDIADGLIVDLRVALGGVAHKPGRDPLAEAAFSGSPADDAAFHRVADRLLAGVTSPAQNCIREERAGGTPPAGRRIIANDAGISDMRIPSRCDTVLHEGHIVTLALSLMSGRT